MTERTPEQTALMDLVFKYGQAEAAPKGKTDDEYQAWENRADGLYRQIEAIVCAPKVEVVWPAHRGRVNNIDFDDDEVTWRGGMPPPPGTHIYTERQVREMLAQKG